MKFLLTAILYLGANLPASADVKINAAEEKVQAAFIYNFLLLTEWPSPPKGNFNICLLGKDPILDSLKQLEVKQAKNHPITVQVLNDVQNAKVCQILFVSREMHPHMREIDNLIADTPVLVVSSENAYDLHDTTIALSSHDGRLSFKINNTAAKNRNMSLSSQLLKLATLVY